MADSTLTTWLKSLAGTFGTELALSDDDYAVMIDWTLEALDLDAENDPPTNADKAVGRAMFWLRIMSLVTGSKDTFDRAKMMYELAIDSASVFLPEINGLTKALLFYDPYTTVEDTDFV